MTHLVLEMGDSRLAVPADTVQEVIFRPPLQSVPEGPAWLAGVFERRGELVTVIDLSVRFGQPVPPRTFDCLAILTHRERKLGLLAQRAAGIVELRPEQMTRPPFYDLEVPVPEPLLQAVATDSQGALLVLDLDPLLRLPDDAPRQRPAKLPGTVPPQSHLTWEREENTLLLTELGGEPVAFQAAQVREVFRPAGLTRVPGAASGVRGLTNLRGTLLAVIDARPQLGLPRTANLPYLMRSGDPELGAALAIEKAVTVRTRSEAATAGQVRLDDRVVRLFDLDRLLREAVTP